MTVNWKGSPRGGRSAGRSLVASGQIDLEPIITHYFPLDDIQKSFEFIDGGGDGGTLRGVIQICAGE